MKNLKIIVILFLLVAVSYFLFMVTGRKEVAAPTMNGVGTDLSAVTVQSEVSSTENVAVSEKSYATWTVDGQIYKSLGIQTLQYFPQSVNYPDDGETLLIFGDYDSGTMSLIFPGKRVDKFEGMLGREFYFEPMLHYSYSKDGQFFNFTSIVDITGDPIQIEITRWDGQFIEGNFSGLLTDLQFDGYHYENKINITDGQFKVDLQTHPLKEI
jgi:hypothetical protein